MFPKRFQSRSRSDGQEVLVHARREEAPILLPFPIFAAPDYSSVSGAELKLVGVATGSFGADPEAFARQRGSKEIEFRIINSDAIAFARMVAKIAYATAHANGELRRVKNSFALARAIIEEPNRIGGFVGTLPSPFKRYPGVQHRIFLRETVEPRLLFAEIQLFASTGTPTYSVIIGALG
jgi:hypothetical protein